MKRTPVLLAILLVGLLFLPSASREAKTVERNEEFCCKPGRFSAMSMLLWVSKGRGKGRLRLKEALLGLHQLSGRKLESVMCSEGFNAPVTACESSDQPSKGVGLIPSVSSRRD